MKIQYCSDLHLEFDDNSRLLNEYPIIPVGDILILAGDIIPFPLLDKCADFLHTLSDRFKTVYWLPGNHEYYGADIMHRSGKFFEKIRENVFLLNNHVQTVGDTRLIFTTLWSYISPVGQWVVQNRINDFRVIRYGDKRLSTAQYNKFHQEAQRFLSEALNQPFHGRTLVITHHVPTMQYYPEQYKGDILNQAFASEQSPFIETSGADYWIYGHHHSNIAPFCIGKTTMLTNQLGYVSHGEHKGFNRQVYLEV